MATGDISQSFTQQFEVEVKHAYQRASAYVRGTVRTITGIVGASTTVQKIGRAEASTKTRHGLVPTANLDHTPVTLTLSDIYLGEWIDHLDTLKVRHDERAAVTYALGAAQARATDKKIIDAMAAATNTNAITLTSSITFRNGILDAIAELKDQFVDASQLTALISPKFWSWMMTVEEFASADFLGMDGLPYKQGSARPGTQMKWALGVTWIEHTGLPKATNTRTNFLYDRNAVAHGIGADVMTDIAWHNDRAAHFVATRSSQGAVIVDADGILEMTIDESTALPTS